MWIYSPETLNFACENIISCMQTDVLVQFCILHTILSYTRDLGLIILKYDRLQATQMRWSLWKLAGFFWVQCESTMKFSIWASCEAFRGFLFSKYWVKIKLGKTPEEILNRFDTNYTVLLVWKYTLLESLTIIILNYKHCKHIYSRPINEAIVSMQCP